MADDEIQKIWMRLEQSFEPARAKGVNTRIQFEIEDGEMYYLEIKNQQLSAGVGKIANPRVTLSATASDLSAIFNGRLDPNAAFFQGRLHIQGDIRLAMQIRDFFK
jgi:predicted lipid carrier protein YhbT